MILNYLLVSFSSLIMYLFLIEKLNFVHRITVCGSALAFPVVGVILLFLQIKMNRC